MQRKKYSLRALSLAALLGATLVVAMPGSVSAADEGEFTLNLNNVDIHSLIGTVSKNTGKNFVVDPRVKARVTVVSAEPMDSHQLYQVFLSVLQVHGYAAVPTGDIIKIVPEVSAKQGPTPGYTIDGGDELVTTVVPVENVPAAQLVPILRPLVPQQGHLAAYAATNSLIITDRAANIARLNSIIRRIDKPDNEEIELVRLHHASASEVVRILNSLQASGGRAAAGGEAPGQSPATLAADERTNSVLISGERAARLRLRGLIAHLDTPLESDGNTRVVYLRYANAQEMADILKGVSQGQAKVDAASAAGGNAKPSGGGARDNVDIQADANTNSLIITAPPGEMRSVMSVISQLDIRRAQVLVEAIIAEISEDNRRSLGVSFAADGRGSQNPVGFSNLGGMGNELAAAIANPASALGSGLSLALGDFDGNGVDFGFLVRAIASNANNNILSTPSLVTMDNQEAEIVVGQNVPFITGTTASNNNDNPFQTIERQDVGLSLKVKPQINEGDTIKLEIEQEVSSIANTAQAGSASDIVTNKRSIKTAVLVEDGQTLVLGGLIDDQLRDSEEKVPLLGDIPVLGHLFRYRGTSKTKQNLMVFLHPVIMRDPKIAESLSGEKYNYLRAQQLVAEDNSIGLLDNAQPILPEFDVLFDGESLGGASSPPKRSSKPEPLTKAPAEPTATPAPVAQTTPSSRPLNRGDSDSIDAQVNIAAPQPVVLSSRTSKNSPAALAQIASLRVGTTGNRTRLVFDLDRDLAGNIEQIDNPDGSITMKLKQATLGAGFEEPRRVRGISQLRVEQHGDDVHLQITPEGPALISHHTLAPFEGRGYRFLIDMRGRKRQAQEG